MVGRSVGWRSSRPGNSSRLPTRRGGGPVTTTATIRVPGLKVTVPLSAAALPRDLVPMDGPAGEPVLDLVVEGGVLTVRAKLNGKNYRKLLKQIAEHGSDHVAVALLVMMRRPQRPARFPFPAAAE